MKYKKPFGNDFWVLLFQFLKEYRDDIEEIKINPPHSYFPSFWSNDFFIPRLDVCLKPNKKLKKKLPKEQQLIGKYERHHTEEGMKGVTTLPKEDEGLMVLGEESHPTWHLPTSKKEAFASKKATTFMEVAGVPLAITVALLANKKKPKSEVEDEKKDHKMELLSKLA